MIVSNIFWHNISTGEGQIWFMDVEKIVSRANVIGEDGKQMKIGPPFSIVGIGDFNGNGKADILFHNAVDGTAVIWFMDGARIARRALVVGEDGKPMKIGPPFTIVGTGDFNGNGKADILFHNSTDGTIVIWFMNDARIAGRAVVVGEDGKTSHIGPPFSIVGVGDMNGNGKADIVWHNSSTNETQIWFMNAEKVTTRRVVVGEDGKQTNIGPPWSIFGIGDMNGNGKADIVWHNSSTNEIQIWFMNGESRTTRRTVVGEDGKPIFVGVPWSIVGVGSSPDLDAITSLFSVHQKRTGGVTGPVGIAMGPVQKVNNRFQRTYSGGVVELFDFTDGPQGFHRFRGEVRFVGFRCHHQSENGVINDGDEPYFIVGVQGQNDKENMTKTFGPFSHVSSLTNTSLETMITTTAQPPITITVVAMENDSGSPAEASAKVEKALNDASARLTLALPLLGVDPSVGAYIQSFINILGGPVADGFSSLFGMGDDLIGQNAKHLVEFDQNVTQWTSPAPRTAPDFSNPFNIELVLDNGEGGRYSAFLQVDLFKDTVTKI
jgi:hypothetical protein